MKYSQNDEQLYIEDYFSDKPIGKFIDIGAYHITRFSNTRRLYENGFEGILVEPQPKNYSAIADHYKDEPRIEVLNFAVGEPGNIDVDFYESDGDAVGTTDFEHMEKWKKGGVNYTKIKVKQVGVEDFFNQYGHGVDMISIDTEATNMVVFRHVPEWFWKEVKLVVIEHDGCQEEIEETLNKYGFSTLHVNNENIISAKL